MFEEKLLEITYVTDSLGLKNDSAAAIKGLIKNLCHDTGRGKNRSIRRDFLDLRACTDQKSRVMS